MTMGGCKKRILRLYKTPALSHGAENSIKEKVSSLLKVESENLILQTEMCFYLECNSDLTENQMEILQWILNSPVSDQELKFQSALIKKSNQLLIEIGPRLNFSTPFSSNAVSMCHAVDLKSISRIECSIRYMLDVLPDTVAISLTLENKIVECLHDKMTQCRYKEPVDHFDLDIVPEDVYEIDLLSHGRKALEQANTDLGLAFDDWDLDHYTTLFRDGLKINPTSVECFDLAQSNSEHSRHWFFKGRMIIDGEEKDSSLFDMVMQTQDFSNPNNVIKFSDNSSAIRGDTVKVLVPEHVSQACMMKKLQVPRHIIFTAETHNFPTGVAPFPGATTGTGGRIRDVQAAGMGAHVIAGTAGYSFGCLNLPGYDLPWENKSFIYPHNLASPARIAVEASNGASDYGNKFGEPVLAGFARSFGMLLPNGERREWLKPIMFTGGIGSLDDRHKSKLPPSPGMLVAKLGGPVYRIGVGGGAASSIQVQGDNESDLDFGAVQRGDAEMEQKMNRVIRACIEMGSNNPICSIHDQGAGGNGNVLKEICEPAGALIHLKEFELGDPTLSVLEIWGAEYQESNALLVAAENKQVLIDIAKRERCPVCFVGEITGDGKIVVVDDRYDDISDDSEPSKKKTCHRNPVDLELSLILGSKERKVFKESHPIIELQPLVLPSNLTILDALERVLRLPSVASKRYLTNKVDRAVTGLVAQQQCVGPLHTPLADVAVVAMSHFDSFGGATAIGEQPIKGLIDPGCGARMAVGEALTNLVFAEVTDLRDVKCSANWMWPAKLPGEGALLYDACKAMCDVMRELGVAVDGGKDSLSMAARVDQEPVKAPGTLVISAYVGCPNITATVTPDLKCPNGRGALMYIPFCDQSGYLGGSALAQCFQQLGNQSPDLNNPDLFKRAFSATQECLKKGLLYAGHDVSDGGLITCLLEMAFAGNCGLNLDIPNFIGEGDQLNLLFSEDLGIVIEIDPAHMDIAVNEYTFMDVPCHHIGYSEYGPQQPEILLKVEDEAKVMTIVLAKEMTVLRDLWEATSFELEKLQANPECVNEEQDGMKDRKIPPYHLSFNANDEPAIDMEARLRVAVIREEGSNGDREMASAFFMAGFEVWDVNMEDLCSGKVTLNNFTGAAFVGGFSYADVMGSAKGWAATIKYNEPVKRMFQNFLKREDTFSLGVCNGCQLMTLLGWVGAQESSTGTDPEPGVFMDHNKSERYESRFSTVKIEASPSIMFAGMADSVLGVWVQHGEGRFTLQADVLNTLQQQSLVPLYYVDDEGKHTETYPHNPNGSKRGIAALCSPDGRHLAIMPHPERTFLTWQWPWMPQEWKDTLTDSPWMCIFRNAYKWCLDKTNS